MIELNSKQLDQLQSSINTKAIKENEEYYAGRNPEILAEKARRKPDNKIPVALGFRLISSLSGYAGRTGDIYIKQVNTTEGAEDTKESQYIKDRKEIEKNNNDLLLNSLQYTEVLKQGIAYEAVWTEKDAKTSKLTIKYAQIPTAQGAPVWNNELQTVKKLKYFVRFWSENIVMGADPTEMYKELKLKRNSPNEVHHAQAFEAGGYQKYFKLGAGKWKKDGEFILQPFEGVQVGVYRASADASSYIQPVKVLLDQLDKIISRNMNEVERFNNTLLGVLKKLDPETKKKIDNLGVFDNLAEGMDDTAGDKFPKFINRDIPVNHATLMIDTLTDLITIIMASPDFTSEKFGTASGIALLYKLIGLEYSASEIDIWYDQGILTRNELINDAMNSITTAKESENFEPVVVHNRNLPVDVAYMVENAQGLKALGVTMDTILALFPKSIIPDVKKELEAIENTVTNPDLIPPLPGEDKIKEILKDD